MSDNDLDPRAYRERYTHLRFDELSEDVLEITIDRPQRLNAMNERLHWEMSRVFFDIEDDPASVVVVTGAGGNFSSGGDLEMVARMTEDHDLLSRQLVEATNVARGIINSSKIVISAIEGYAVGAGLAVALLADISVAAASAKLNDGHLRLGVVAGDHAALVWPLLCGMARSKYYLLMGEFVDGRLAADMGLVSRCVDDGAALVEAERIAHHLAQAPREALSWTKRSLNSWFQVASPGFEQSVALEMLSFGSPAVAVRAAALRRVQSNAQNAQL